MIGVDEAGYGPNLGPFAVGVSLWHLENADPCSSGLRERLAPLFRSADDLDGATDCEGTGAIIDDSKRVYSPKLGLAGLTVPVLSLMRLLDQRPESALDVVEAMRVEPHREIGSHPGYDWSAVPDPVKHHMASIDALEQASRRHFANRGVQLVDLAGTLIFPEEWNSGLVRHETKSRLLSFTTFHVVRKMLERIERQQATRQQPVLISCDKHGGRNCYAALIQAALGDVVDFVRVVSESRERSLYSWRTRSGQPVEMEICMGGESRMQVALASMAAKLARELCMQAWNAYWKNIVPGLQPTAGYPVDAKRFRRDIADAVNKSGIAESAIWRVK